MTTEPGPAEGVSTPGFGPCYRHPGQESGVRCSRCERPICPRCMIQAPVGFQCPECVRASPGVRRPADLRPDPYATLTLIALNVAAYLPSLAAGGIGLFGGNVLAGEFALVAGPVAAGEWWRLVTSGFLHYGLGHLAFNMMALWILGGMLEPSLGRARFVGVYLAGLLGGAGGALLLSPDAVTAGASGAVFGLMGAAFLAQRRRGVDPWRSGIGTLLVVNLLITFAVPGISVGGHLGGLIGGALAGAVVEGLDERGLPSWSGAVGSVAVAALIGAAALAVATNPVL